jgi:dolichol-phosphate mannosyltransferase
VYKERDNIVPLVARLTKTLEAIPGCRHEIVFALDPTTDGTEERILSVRERDPRVKLLRFSRRFGQPAATLAGLQHARGDVCVVIDADLQDPPELITELVRTWRETGAEVVYAQRRTREGETMSKRAAAALGYWLINRIATVEIPRNTGDFRLMTRRVVNHLLRLKESHGFLRGMVALVGFKQAAVQYDRAARQAGRGHYNRWIGSWAIAINGVVGFSNYLLSVITFIGFATAAFAFILGITYVVLSLLKVRIVWGNPTLVILLTFFSGIQLLCIGLLGEYVGRIYDEVRQRPRYIVESMHGIED